MDQPIIYLASVAGSCTEMLSALGCAGGVDLIGCVQAAVGDGYLVEGDPALIEAGEHDARGGRFDDAERAAAIERRFADDRTAAFVALRGGAWLTRILGRIDFEVLGRRRRRIALFGFSELTTLLNIASTYPRAFCLYDLGPGFIRKGLDDHARRQRSRTSESEVDARFRAEFAAFFQDVTAVLEGTGSYRGICGTLVRGACAGPSRVRFVGGNLAVLTTLLGTPFAAAIDPRGRWLAIEDVNESLDRVDRRLAHLKLAGLFERCKGMLIGDFHDRDTDHQEAIVELLTYHLPPDRNVPVITTHDVGHVWPLAPLPLNSPVRLRLMGRQDEPQRVRFDVVWPSILTRSSKVAGPRSRDANRR